MEWSLKKYEELKLSELYELLKLRASVFVVEQDCPYLDLDGKDSLATHILGYQRNKLVAYSRVFRPGSFEKKHARIGRIVVQKKAEERASVSNWFTKASLFAKNTLATKR